MCKTPRQQQLRKEFEEWCSARKDPTHPDHLFALTFPFDIADYWEMVDGKRPPAVF